MICSLASPHICVPVTLTQQPNGSIFLGLPSFSSENLTLQETNPSFTGKPRQVVTFQSKTMWLSPNLAQIAPKATVKPFLSSYFIGNTVFLSVLTFPFNVLPAHAFFLLISNSLCLEFLQWLK